MGIKITNDGIYRVNITNVKNEDVELGIDVLDIAQVDNLMSLLTTGESLKEKLDKRFKKAEKEYKEEIVLIRQKVRITRETISEMNAAIDLCFGENKSFELFGSSLALNQYFQFLTIIENQFGPAIEKGKKEQERMFAEWDKKYSESDDDVL